MGPVFQGIVGASLIVAIVLAFTGTEVIAQIYALYAWMLWQVLVR